MAKRNGYELTRRWFDFAFEKKEAKSFHTAMFCWLVELNNRMGWKEEFGLPTRDTMDGLKIGNRNTYHSVLKDLQAWGFIKIVQEAKNQYQSMFVTICHTQSEQAVVSALDQALVRQRTGTVSGSVPIDKQVNNETDKQGKKSVFVPPLLLEVEAYFLEYTAGSNWNTQKSKTEAQKFLSFYESKGWMVGKAKMIKWKASVVGWVNRDEGFEKGGADSEDGRKATHLKPEYGWVMFNDGSHKVVPQKEIEAIQANPELLKNYK